VGVDDVAVARALVPVLKTISARAFSSKGGRAVLVRLIDS